MYDVITVEYRFPSFAFPSKWYRDLEETGPDFEPLPPKFGQLPRIGEYIRCILKQDESIIIDLRIKRIVHTINNSQLPHAIIFLEEADKPRIPLHD